MDCFVAGGDWGNAGGCARRLGLYDIGKKYFLKGAGDEGSCGVGDYDDLIYWACLCALRVGNFESCKEIALQRKVRESQRLISFADSFLGGPTSISKATSTVPMSTPFDNQLDNPLLITLDDKVLFDELVRGAEYYPTADGGAGTYVRKERFSHGGNGVTLYQHSGGPMPIDDACVYQKFVSGERIGGKAYSIRCYVLTNEGLTRDLFVSRRGLIKLASEENNFVTNSANGGEQREVELDKFLEDQVVEIVKDVFIRLWRKPGYKVIKSANFAKLLGFDFLVENGKMKLLEVNRFPGLSPRSSSDVLVKRAMVGAAEQQQEQQQQQEQEQQQQQQQMKTPPPSDIFLAVDFE